VGYVVPKIWLDSVSFPSQKEVDNYALSKAKIISGKGQLISE